MKKQTTLIILMLIILNSCNESDNAIRIDLTPQNSESGTSLRWSPKGKKIPLSVSGNNLSGRLVLGPENLSPIGLQLSKSSSSEYYDRLSVDKNRNGQWEENEILTCTPSERRGKFWSSFSTSIEIPFESENNDPILNPYPLSFWYVEDPLEEPETPVIRYSRRGWMEGRYEKGNDTFWVMLCEMDMDGIFDRNDRWAMAPDSAKNILYQSGEAKSTDSHAWLGEQAFIIDTLHESGRRMTIQPVDVNMTRAEEETANDWLAPDKAEKRSGNKVSFLHDYEKAVAMAKKEKKNLLIDFETTWCGPCKMMDRWVYTADKIVNASKNIIAVKVDGDENRSLVKKFKVQGYPTLLLTSSEGKIIKRATGYQSVAETLQIIETKEN